ncbi:jg3597 [Pararge aegeria aegeria]|uniref:Jg3597 protein n=1 Tax=Pararge aegeria aegeria TaxID=348720 RepID=A0A8S4QW50_9NEOP|nr:jg3597 [Pararge aegeria aegeria]
MVTWFTTCQQLGHVPGALIIKTRSWGRDLPYRQRSPPPVVQRPWADTGCHFVRQVSPFLGDDFPLASSWATCLVRQLLRRGVGAKTCSIAQGPPHHVVQRYPMLVLQVDRARMRVPPTPLAPPRLRVHRLPPRE